MRLSKSELVPGDRPHLAANGHSSREHCHVWEKTFDVYWVLLVIDVFTRRIIGLGVEREYIEGLSVCRMFNRAVAGQPVP